MASGLQSVELDELTTNQIIINNDGLQYKHRYNILLPTINECYYNLQEEMDNIIISNTTQDIELFTITNALSTATANITSLGVLAATANLNALLAMDLANNKNWLIFWHAPFNYNLVNNHVYFNYDTNYFSRDASNNLTFNGFWGKDISNNLYFTSGKIGIGITSPNYDLDGLNNINCYEKYRNGTPLSSTLSLFLP